MRGQDAVHDGQEAGRAAGPVRASPDWLDLREPADAAARSAELVDELGTVLPSGEPVRIHDLGAGTGSMARWLAPRLPGAQHWLLHDRDTDLLADARRRPPPHDRDGAPVTVVTRPGDLTRLSPDDLAGAHLVTASALLDMLTEDELARLVATCAEPGCPVLVTLSVVGRVELEPTDPLDDRVTEAFNDHQRRASAAGRLLGPDAVGAAVAGFRRLGREVVVRPSPWRLGPDHTGLAASWLRGWCAAAREQRPDLAGELAAYERRRLAEVEDGTLSVTVHHEDLLVLPGRRR